MDEFRRFFVRGLAALLPTLLTIAVIAWAYGVVNNTIGVYVTRGLLAACRALSPQPAPGWIDPDRDALLYGQPIDEWDSQAGRRLTLEYKTIHQETALHSSDAGIKSRAQQKRDEALWRIAFAKYKLHLLGFLIAIVLVYFIGFFLASFIGRTSWRMAERLLHRIPVIRAIYPNIKQVTDFLLSERQLEFAGVVLVEYPRKGCWSLGLATGGPMRELHRRRPEDFVTVFIPSSPMPMTGYVIQVPRSDVIEIGLSIDEALRFTISGGVIRPGEPTEVVLPAPTVTTPGGTPSGGDAR